jgi:hypothetical protein
MINRHFRIAAAAAAAAGLALVAHAAAATPEYTYQVLRAPAGYSLLSVNLGPSGEVVGGVSPKGGERMATYAVLGADHRVWNVFGGNSSLGEAVNARGDILGEATYPDGTSTLYLQPAGGRAFPLFADGAYPGADGSGVNASDTVIGHYLDSSGNMVPFSWQSGVVTPLPTFGGVFNNAIAINDAGTIVGIAGSTTAGSYATTPVRWDAGVMHILPSLPGALSAAPYSISSNGIIGGAIETATVNTLPCLWQPDGTLTMLPTYPGSFTAEVNGVNTAGVAVGYDSGAPQRDANAVIWRDGTVLELKKLVDLPQGWAIRNAYAINDAGQILVFGYDGNGNPDYMLLTPIAQSPR